MSAVGRPKKKALKAAGPKLEVLKVGARSRDAIKKVRDYSTPRQVMTVAEIAEYLKVQRITIYRLARKGKIPAFKPAATRAALNLPSAASQIE